MTYIKPNAGGILRTLDKGLYVLAVLGSKGDSSGLTITELSEAVGIHRTTLFRILGTLEARNFVVRDETTDRYRIGMGVLVLASMLIRDLDIRRVAGPVLQSLCHKTHELVLLTVMVNDEVVTIDRFESDQDLSLRVDIGTRRPAYCSASGKAILAYLPDNEVERILNMGMPAHTLRTITSPVVMHHHLNEVRARGFAVDDEERAEGMRCVAAPLFGSEGTVQGAISIAAPTMRTPLQRLHVLGEETRKAARQISERLGFTKH